MGRFFKVGKAAQICATDNCPAFCAAPWRCFGGDRRGR